MVEAKTTIVNPTGLHARSASQFISFVNKFKCTVTFIKDGHTANAKSILNVLIMGLNQGSEVTVRVEGKGEETVLEEILEYIKSMKD